MPGPDRRQEVWRWGSEGEHALGREHRRVPRLHPQQFHPTLENKVGGQSESDLVWDLSVAPHKLHDFGNVPFPL